MIMQKKSLHVVVSLALTVIGTGCSGVLADVVVPQTEAGSSFWELKLNYPAINLAMTPPYNTVQLSVTPYDEQGEPILGGDAKPVFTVLDVEKLAVDSNGVLTALGTGSGIRVIASLQLNGVTRVDTGLVRVVATPPASPLATLSIPNDNPRLALGSKLSIRPVVKNSANGNLSGLQIAYRTSSLRIATVTNSGSTNASLEGKRIGKVWIFASTYAFGIERIDSTEYRIVLPRERVVDVELLRDGTIAFWPATVEIAVGGAVIWRDAGNRFLQTNWPGLIFEDPSVALNYDFGPGISASLGHPEFALETGDLVTRPSIVVGGIFVFLGWRRFEAIGTHTYYDGQRKTVGRITVRVEEE